MFWDEQDAFEDRRRHLSDQRINNSTCRVYRADAGERYVRVLFSQLKVGDIVHLSCDEVIPADVLVLRSSDKHGLCFIGQSRQSDIDVDVVVSRFVSDDSDAGSFWVSRRNVQPGRREQPEAAQCAADHVGQTGPVPAASLPQQRRVRGAHHQDLPVPGTLASSRLFFESFLFTSPCC